MFYSMLRMDATDGNAGANERLLYPIRESRPKQGGSQRDKEIAETSAGQDTGKRSRLPVWVSGLEGRLMSLKYDGTINLGHILTIATLIAMMAIAYATYKVSISDHDSRISSLEAQVKSQWLNDQATSTTLYEIKQDVAVIKDRLNRSGNVPK